MRSAGLLRLLALPAVVSLVFSLFLAVFWLFSPGGPVHAQDEKPPTSGPRVAASLSLSDGDLEVSYSAVGGAETLNIGVEKRSSGGGYGFYAERTITSPGSSGTVTFESPEAGTYRGYGEECFEGDNCGPRITTNTVTVTESIDILELASSIDERRSDSFSVRAMNLEPKVAYRIEMSRDTSSIGFDNSCKATDESGTLSGQPSYTRTFTLYGCVTPGGTVTASLFQGTSKLASDSQYVTVNDVNVPPDITGGDDSPTYEEGDTASVETYTAYDEDGDDISWSLPNTIFEKDRFDFSISSGGVLTFDTSPNYESPHDHNRNNIYLITVRASDGRGGTDDLDVTVTVTNLPPTFTSGPSSVSYAECGTVSAGTYRASDPGGGTISWSLPNTSFETDRGDFDISSRGVLTFDSSPNHESPADHNRDNVYRITVRASDASGAAADRNVTVTVTNRHPTITSGLFSRSYAEGGTGSVSTYVGTDPCGGAISWSLPNTSFEKDRFDFSISSRGVLTFDRSPNYESPHDSNRDNEYRITVRASDGSGAAADRNVTITVTNRPPDIKSGLFSRRYAEGVTGSVSTYVASDPGGGTISWSLPNTGFETDRGDFDMSSSGVLTFEVTPDYENPDDHDGDNVYRVTVRASDDDGLSDNRNVTITVTDVNEKPSFDEGASTTRDIEENVQAGTGIFLAVSATDPEIDTLTYSLTGTDSSSFSIVASSGQLRTSAPLDYEAKSSYSVTVEVSDRKNRQGNPDTVVDDTIPVTINITNVNERPVVDSEIADRTMTAGTATTIDLSAHFNDPDGDTLIYTATSAPTGVATTSVSGSTLSLAAVSAGSATITVTAADRPLRHPDRLAATRSFTVTVIQPLPTITIARHTDTPPSVTEGTEVRFVLTASFAPAANLDVNVRVTQTGLFLAAATSSQETIAMGTTTAQLILQTDDDSVDEANGTTTAAVLSGTGYIVGSPLSASVVVQDDDRPLTPTGLRANGHLVDGKITLRWNPVAGATGYNVQYVEEVCTPGVRCEPDGGLAPNWRTRTNMVVSTSTVTVGTSTVTVMEATLGGLTEKTLYRVEVQAVIVDASAWSDLVFVYPTRNPLASTTNVALMEIRDFQADGQDAGSYRYTICLDDPMTVSNPMNPAVSGAWTVTDIIAEIKNSIETWETAVGDSGILSTTADSETSPANCEDPWFPSTRNQIVFVDDNTMNRRCHPSAIGCWLNWGGDLSRGVPFDKQSIILSASGRGRAWDTMTNGCSRLRTVVAHEVGHALGIHHPDIGKIPPKAVREMYLMYRKFQRVCEPQAYDVAAAMTNYQSR